MLFLALSSFVSSPPPPLPLPHPLPRYRELTPGWARREYQPLRDLSTCTSTPTYTNTHTHTYIYAYIHTYTYTHQRGADVYNGAENAGRREPRETAWCSLYFNLARPLLDTNIIQLGIVSRRPSGERKEERGGGVSICTDAACPLDSITPVLPSCSRE